MILFFNAMLVLVSAMLVFVYVMLMFVGALLALICTLLLFISACWRSKSHPYWKSVLFASHVTISQMFSAKFNDISASR